MRTCTREARLEFENYVLALPDSAFLPKEGDDGFIATVKTMAQLAVERIQRQRRIRAKAWQFAATQGIRYAI